MVISKETAAQGTRQEWLVAAVALALSMLPVVVLFALRGYSCGHDLPFHLGSWQDAQQQLARGGWPQWDYMAARGAGEPRFVFYPPVSWLVGAALRSVMSPEHAAVAFVLLALSACWCGMYVAARRYTTSAAAMVGATVYALGPYALFNALERSAFAELLAMAGLPLLFVAVLRERVRVVEVASLVALLWLTNVPTAVIGCYMVAGLGLLRLVGELRTRRAQRTRRFAVAVVAGVGIGIGLAGFFLAPAVRQQRAVQIDAAFSEGQTVADNFLLRHTEHSRRGVIHAVSLMTVEALAVLGLALGMVMFRGQGSGFRVQGLVVGAVVVLFLLLPWSLPVWEHLPKLSVLQFPWRLLCVLWMMAALALGMALRSALMRPWAGTLVALVLAVLLGWSGFRQFWLDPQGRENDGVVRAQASPVVERRATNEYTPVGDDNAALREGGPGYWLRLRSTGVAGGPEHGDVVEDVQPLAHAGSDAVAPGHLVLELAQAEVLVLDLRAYPAWRVLRDGGAVTMLPRADGLIAVALPAGQSVVDVVWVPDSGRWVGWLVSMVAAALLWVAWGLELRGRSNSRLAGGMTARKA